MRQYTTLEQTIKLFDLGFEKPKSIEKMIPQGVIEGIAHLTPRRAYSIGELIEMLPTAYDSEGLSIGYHYMADVWIVRYPTKILIHKEELVDALYDMILKLKEEGVI